MSTWQHTLCSFGFAREAEIHGGWVFNDALKRAGLKEETVARTEKEMGEDELSDKKSLLAPRLQVDWVPTASSMHGGKITKEPVSREIPPQGLLGSSSGDRSITPTHLIHSSRFRAALRGKTLLGTDANPSSARSSSPQDASSSRHTTGIDVQNKTSASIEMSPVLQAYKPNPDDLKMSSEKIVAASRDVTMEVLAERRRLQNRIAQRNYRKRMKARLDALDSRGVETENTQHKYEAEETFQTDKSTQDGLDPEVMAHQSTNESVNIRCVCNVDEDRRFIIPCMQCGTWQHIACYYELAADVVEVHECIQCVPRELNYQARDTLKRQAEMHWPEGTFSSTSHSGKRPKTIGAESSIGVENDMSSIATSYIAPSTMEPHVFATTEKLLAHVKGAELKDLDRLDADYLGLSLPSADQSLRRTSHKVAEQGRRNRINIALRDMQALLPESQLDALGPDEFAAQSSSSKAAKTERAIDYIEELMERIRVRDELLSSKSQELKRVKEENAALHQAMNAIGPDADMLSLSQPPDSSMEDETRNSLSGKPPLLNDSDDTDQHFQAPEEVPAKLPIYTLEEDCIDDMVNDSPIEYLRSEKWKDTNESKALHSHTSKRNVAIAEYRERQKQHINELETRQAQMESRAKGAESENKSMQIRIMRLKDELREARDEIPTEPPQDEVLDNMVLTSLEAEEVNILAEAESSLGIDWTQVQRMLPETWMWDVEFHTGCWTCTPLEVDEPKYYPLTIAGAPVVLPVEYLWPPMGGVNPPPDPRPFVPLDCRAEITVDVIRDVFLTFEGSIGFYMLISGLLQIVVPEGFDTEWASSHLPHKYGGLRVCYIPQTMEATMLPSTMETTKTKPALNSQSSSLSSIFRTSRPSTASSSSTLKLNDFIEARPKASHRKERYSGRIGLKVMKDDSPYLIMSTHIITEAILAKSHRDTVFGRGRDRFLKLDQDWNEHVEVWAGNEKVGWIHESFDKEAEAYPNGFPHDVTLIKPSSTASVKDIASPIADLGWLNRESWSSLRQQASAVKILGPTENHRSVKSLRCSRPSEILVVGEGIFLNQAAAVGSSKHLKDHDMSTWKDLVSRALLYRVCPDFDPPNGYSGVALYAEGTREDGTKGPGVVGFQSFVQRSGHVQNFGMEGPALERRLQLGRVAFYGAFEVSGTLKREYTIM
jgi:hypothetical protein